MPNRNRFICKKLPRLLLNPLLPRRGNCYSNTAVSFWRNPARDTSCFGSLEKEAAGLPFSFLEQGGGSLIAFAHGLPAGFVAWRALPAAVAPDACEMKRLWVRPASRGLSLGRMLTLAVMERARTAGYTSIYLDTAPDSMAAAHRLYLDLGFEPCAPYNDNQVDGFAHLFKKL
jgi:ribosomal protein S18 acetylase RimI-like enzyme